MPELKLRLIGPPSVTVNGVPVEIRRRKVLALLAYLAVEQLPQSREVLATLFWPEYSQSEARTDLSRTLWYLKRDLGDGWLAVSRQIIGLEMGAAIWVDVVVCRHLLEECNTHGHTSSEVCEQCAPLFDQVVKHHRGAFMAGFSLPDSSAFDDWQSYQTAEYHRQLGNVLFRLSQHHRTSGEIAPAIAYAKRWLDLDPLHEPAHQHLMFLYARSNQSSEALRQYQQYVHTLKDELGATPGPQITELHEAIRSGSFGGHVAEASGRHVSSDKPSTAIPQRPRHNLPAQTTPFVGREDVLADLTRRLQNRETRLVTIVGPGGMGKTRLAIEIGAACLDNDQQSVYFVSLAPLRSTEELVPAIADAMDLQLQADESPIERQLLEYFRQNYAGQNQTGQNQDSVRLLLVLDNCEHLLAGAILVNDLLEAGPDVCVVATSRERLHLSGETVFLLEGLKYPSVSLETKHAMADMLECDAVQLFLQSARRVRNDFELAPHDLPHLATLCNLVQGMPLGLMLAATWVEVLTIEEIAAELRQSLDFLESELSDLPERQRSMRAIFAHSWQMLGEDERTIFMALSIFRGGFTREAGREVAGASLRDLANLVGKSLVQRDADGRHQVHELLRQFAAEELVASGREGEVLAAHGRYFITFLRERETDLKGCRQAAALQEIEADFDNVRAAWNRAVQREDVGEIDRALESLYWFCVMRSRLPSGYELLRRARESLKHTDEPCLLRVRGRLLSRAMKGTAGLIGNPDELRSNVEQALAIARDIDDRAGIAYGLWSLGLIFMRASEYVRAAVFLEQSLALFRMLEDRFYQAELLGDIGRSRRYQYRQVGRDYLQESLNLKSEIGNEIGAAVSLHELGWQFYVLGEWIEAERYWQDAYSIQARARNRQAMAENLTGLCRLALDRGDLDRVVQLAEEISSIAAEIINVRHQAIPYQYWGAVANARLAYPEARKHFERALSMTQDGDLQVLAELGLAYAALGLNESQHALRHLLHAMRVGGDLWFSFFVGEVVLLQAALLYARIGQPERAAKLHALAFKDSSVTNTYYGRLPLIHRLRGELVTRLSPAQFADAWSEGQTLDLVDTLREVQSELEAMSPQS